MSGSQSLPQIVLITFQPAPRKMPSSSWMILPLPRTGPSSRCRLQLIDEDEVVELLPAGQRDGAQRLRLVGLPVAEERPDLAVRRVGQPAAGQVLQEARLVDRHDRAEAHRHRRHLPVLRHQPRVRVGGQAAAAGLLPELAQLLLGEPALHERAGVDARRRMPLDEQQVTAVGVGRGPEEMLEPHLVQRRRGLEAGDMTAELGGLRVRPQHDGQRVPPDQRPDPVIHRQLARAQPVWRIGRDRVQVRRGGAVRDRRAFPAGLVDHLIQQEERTVRALVGQHGVERLQPLARLGRVKIFQHVDTPIDRPTRRHDEPAALSSSHQRQQSRIAGLRIARMCLIRPPVMSNANTVTVAPSCWATRPGWPLTVHSRIVTLRGERAPGG